MRELLSTRPEIAEIAWEESEALPDADWEGTNFEVKYTREGRSIYRVAFAPPRAGVIHLAERASSAVPSRFRRS